MGIVFGARHDHCGCAERRHERVRARPHRRAVEPDERQHDQGKPGRAADLSLQRRQAHPAHQQHQRPDSEFEGAEEHHVKGEVGVDAGDDIACDQRCREDRQHRPAQGQPEPQAADQQRRPDEIELLLDAERPHMQERLERALGVEIAVREVEIDIGDREHRADRGFGERGVIGRREQDPAGDHRPEHRDDKGKEDATEAAAIKSDEAELLDLDDLLRNQITGDREKDIDRGIAAGQRVDVEMIDEDSQHRESAQAFDIGAKIRNWFRLRQTELLATRCLEHFPAKWEPVHHEKCRPLQEQPE